MFITVVIISVDVNFECAMLGGVGRRDMVRTLSAQVSPLVAYILYLQNKKKMIAFAKELLVFDCNVSVEMFSFDVNRQEQI